MYKDNKDYVAPSVTVLRQDLFSDPITTSGDVNWGIDDNIFPDD